MKWTRMPVLGNGGLGTGLRPAIWMLQRRWNIDHWFLNPV